MEDVQLSHVEAIYQIVADEYNNAMKAISVVDPHMRATQIHEAAALRELHAKVCAYLRSVDRKGE